MTPDKIERVFGRGRLKMATGEHVEVFREAVAPGERRRYTKRFLETGDADFRQWTQREWRILARLIGHGVRCVPDVVQFDGGAMGGMRQVQTYDAGITVDQWATLLPVMRAGIVRRNMFEDCAHWWALAHHCLAALDEIHRLQLVHLDIKADNICIPCDPPTFDAHSPDGCLYPAFARLALIDFAFSLVSREPLATALPLGWQKDYDYQSPRLLRALEAGAAGEFAPTQELDWRCDLYSLAAMLRRYLPDDEWARSQGHAFGWTAKRYEEARSLIYRLRDCHDRELPSVAPHAELMQTTTLQLASSDLAQSLAAGWQLAQGDESIVVPVQATPMTRIAAPRIVVTPAAPAPATVVTEVPAVFRNTRVHVLGAMTRIGTRNAGGRPRSARYLALAAAFGAAVIGASVLLGYPEQYAGVVDRLRSAADRVSSALAPAATPAPERVTVAQAPVTPTAAPQASAPAPANEDPQQEAHGSGTTAEPSPSADGPAAENADRAVEMGGARKEPATSSPPPVESAPAPTNAGPVAQPSVSSPQTSSTTPASARASKRAGTMAPPAPAHRPAIVATAPRTTGATSHERASRVAHPPAPPLKASPPNVDLAAAAKATQALVNASLASVKQSSSLDAPQTSPSTPPTAVADAAPARPEPAAETRPAAGATPQPAPTPEPLANAPAARAESHRPRVVPSSAPIEPWRAALHDMLAALGVTEQRPAPVEERSLGASPARNPARNPQPSSRISAPLETQRTDTIRPQAPAVTSPLNPPQRIAEVQPGAISPRIATSDESNSDLLRYQARQLLTVDVPRIAAMAQNDMAPVLWNAAGAEHPAQDRAVLNAAIGSWPSERAPITAPATRARGQYLYADAKQAFALGRDQEALDLAMRAFAASPRDPEIAGFLALLHLRVKPLQPEAARQLALYALATSGATRSVRLEDWNTFAVASALSGRDSDATRAMLAELALSNDLERSCRAALGAYNMYGERLRAPVQAMLYRVHAQGRDRDSVACRWGSMRAMRYAGVESGRF